jgi:hypothetical protein
MGDKDFEWGIVLIVISVFFLIASMGLLDYTVLSEGLSAGVAYVLVALGAYLVSKGK